ncbi:MAG: threonylcarbamoyl-AMP synthase [Bacilli bacterium]|nr:threonylcarbamoyl-AMP synthase [Bacilli bacterium]
MIVLNKSCSDLLKASRLLKRGKLVAFPTETVYGVACRFDSIKAYRALNKLKRRTPDKPYTLMLGDVNEIKKFAKLNKKTAKFIKKVLPGSVTLILPVKIGLPKYLSKDGYIGIRVPNYKLTLDLLKLSGPLLVPSLNRNGKDPLNDIKLIKKEFGKELDAVINDKIKKDKPSTILLISDKIKVIREGKIPSRKLIEVYNKL